ncbi:MAG: nucleotidyl transferase AbiEii/AbiGii toxin family protein [Lachnoclostridium sp.]|jgi:predicted nucleotidyltransferase component of viral defense system|nr:nucleotidyl transferase AbiEii/AbiGii toxin family protein [Lachnoclostridium sp.]
MPNYDKLTLGRKAKELGFIRDAYEKMSRLTEILQFLNTEQELSLLLALKGGTAINLTVFNLPRLSVDIDLDFAENLSKEETRKQRNRINEILGRYMTAEGYTFHTKSKQTHALDSFVFSYTNAAGNLDNIKVEINYMLRCHALPTVENIAQPSEAFAAFPIRTLAPAEIFASKIVALSSRAAARDLYDLNNMIYFGLFDEADLILLRKCTVMYFAIAGDMTAQGFHFDKMTKITEKTIKADLYPMIRHAEQFDFAAAKGRVSVFLSELMNLKERETAFLQRFSTGHYEPYLLFEDKDTIDRITNHPMAAWRINRIKNQLGNKMSFVFIK